MRRVVVKARIVQLNAAARRPTPICAIATRRMNREGECGRPYGPETNATDGRELVERGREDRHQFRLSSPEDGDRLSDQRGLTCDMTRRV